MISLITILLFVSIAVFELDSFARVGGGRSFGGRGTRSYSPPNRQYSSPSPSRQQTATPPGQPAQQPTGGGFLRSFGGGLLGGLLGGIRPSAAWIRRNGRRLRRQRYRYLRNSPSAGSRLSAVKMIKRKRGGENPAYQSSYQQGGYQTETPAYGGSGQPGEKDMSDGISHIRQMDPSFDEGRFKDTAMDIFFKLQGAWMNRDLSPVDTLLQNEMKGIIQKDIDNLLREKRVNRLENIAVRNIEIVEAWQESGQDFLTVLFTANLLDYTTDDSTGKVVEGSKTDPVKFEEFWTFTRALGNNPWRLSAINQP